jgi:hypothetical protein
LRLRSRFRLRGKINFSSFQILAPFIGKLSFDVLDLFNATFDLNLNLELLASTFERYD